MTKLRLTPLLAVAALSLGGCQTQPERLQIPAPLAIAHGSDANQRVTIQSGSTPRTHINVTNTPVPPGSVSSMSGLHATQNLPPLQGEPITTTLSNMPLPAFINEVYGNLLHLNYVLDPRLSRQTDMVTLRVTDPTAPKDFYQLVAQVLQRYGIAVSWDGRSVNLLPAKDAASGEPPIIISGRALPNVPESHRPVFQLVQLHAVSGLDVANWLTTAYKNSQLSVTQDTNRNGVVLSGPPDLVAQAVQAVAVLDRPYLRGSHSRRIEPAFMSADKLAGRLVEVLKAEGYAANSDVGPNVSIIVLPITETNTVLVFAPNETTLNHVVQWAATVDQPNPSSSSDSIFYYPVENTKAADIASVINGQGGNGDRDLTMGSNSSAQSGDQFNAQRGNDTSNANATNTRTGATGKGKPLTTRGDLLVDGQRNALIFRGDPAEWKRLLPLIQQMDRPTRQVMIEVTIAEVTLDDGQQLGLDWLAKDNHGKYSGSYQFGSLSGEVSNGSDSGSGGTGGAFGGLTYLIDIAGVNRARLTAIAQKQNVTILSTPRVLVKSGEEASIDVGTEVPTLTAQTASTQQSEGSSNLLQSIQYHKTGIILDVKPTIYSDNRIDLDISQEVSEAQNASSDSGVNSPSIFNRSVKTSLSLQDGGSVVLGGLVSSKETSGNSGIPFLKDIPILGHLFKRQSKDKSRTELLIMIVPYIIESDQQAKAVTKAVVNSMTALKPADVQPKLSVPPKPAAVTPIQDH